MDDIDVLKILDILLVKDGGRGRRRCHGDDVLCGADRARGVDRTRGGLGRGRVGLLAVLDLGFTLGHLDLLPALDNRSTVNATALDNLLGLNHLSCLNDLTGLDNLLTMDDSSAHVALNDLYDLTLLRVVEDAGGRGGRGGRHCDIGATPATSRTGSDEALAGHWILTVLIDDPPCVDDSGDVAENCQHNTITARLAKVKQEGRCGKQPALLLLILFLWLAGHGGRLRQGAERIGQDAVPKRNPFLFIGYFLLPANAAGQRTQEIKTTTFFFSFSKNQAAKCEKKGGPKD